jgi:hypothetical protein
VRWFHFVPEISSRAGAEHGARDAVLALRGRKAAFSIMAVFNVRLLDSKGEVFESKEIRAIRNYEAIEAAVVLCHAALTRCGGYEVWRDGRAIARYLIRR